MRPRLRDGGNEVIGYDPRPEASSVVSPVTQAFAGSRAV